VDTAELCDGVVAVLHEDAVVEPFGPRRPGRCGRAGIGDVLGELVQEEAAE
jgi:hypothetical protein